MRKKKAGWSLTEFLIFLLVVACIQIAFFSRWAGNVAENFFGRPENFVRALEQKMSLARNLAIIQLKEQQVIFRKGEHFYGFYFTHEFLLKYNLFGVIEKGNSAQIQKNEESYRLTVSPVTAEIHFVKVR